VDISVEGKGKTGVLTVCLDGLNVTMSRFPKKPASRASTSNGELFENLSSDEIKLLSGRWSVLDASYFASVVTGQYTMGLILL
jgi:hypothetical protein